MFGYSTIAWSQQSALDDELKQLFLSEREAYLKLLRGAATESSADPNIDVTYYKLDLRITTAPEYLKGVVTVKAISQVDGLRQVTLDLMENLQVTAVQDGSTNLSFSQSPTTVEIVLDRSYDQGEMISFDIHYEGRPGRSGFGSFTFSDHDGVPWVWTLSEPYGAKDWWPSKDHPSDKADSVDVWVTCDASLQVASNGILVDVIDNGDGTRTYKWQERYPISTYLVSLAITNYETFSNWFRYSPTDSMEVVNYVLPERLDLAKERLPVVVRQLEIFSELFGEYPFLKEKYGHAQFGWGGGMEHQTMTSLGSFNSRLLAHELAHQWFGDKITCRTWPNIWLNEGFATYSTALYLEAEGGEAAYRGYMSRIMTDARLAQGPLYVADTSSVSGLFSWPLVYAKGATVLHMLRHVLGDSLFFDALRAYAQEPRLAYKTAVTEDFQQVCERVAQMDLDFFFYQWIYGEGYPRYDYSWTAGAAGDVYEVRIDLRQQPTAINPSFFVMPIDFSFASGAWDTTVTFYNDAPQQTFLVQLPQLPDTVLLDPEDWILKEVSLLGSVQDSTSRPPERFRLEQNYPNPVLAHEPSGPAVTSIVFYLAEPSTVNLTLYNVLGQEVEVLARGPYRAGRHQITLDASALVAGIYFYRLEVAGQSQMRTLVIR